MTDDNGDIEMTEEMRQLLVPTEAEDHLVVYNQTLKQLRDHWELEAIKSQAEARRLERQLKAQALMIEQLKSRLGNTLPAPSGAQAKKQKEMN